MRVVVIDYQLGNIGSIINMLKRVGATAMHSSAPNDIYAADKLILPGVGAFDHGIKNLQATGLIDILNEAVLVQKKPILGICLGMQLLLNRSEEGMLSGFGWIPGHCARFKFSSEKKDLKIPHMGWNMVKSNVKNALLCYDTDSETRFYFVHSYHAVCENPNDVLGVCHYGYPFPAFIGRDHIQGVQFHPEKSHKYGMQLLKNFIDDKT